jgi:hypothetical protein
MNREKKIYKYTVIQCVSKVFMLISLLESYRRLWTGKNHHPVNELMTLVPYSNQIDNQYLKLSLIEIINLLQLQGHVNGILVAWSLSEP